MGGSQSKDTDQTLNKLINKTYGTKLAYVPFKSGGEAATQLAGEAHQLEHEQSRTRTSRSGARARCKPLCVFAKERMKYKEKVTATMAWGDIPTCKEQGLPIDQYQMPRVIYMSSGASSPTQMAFYADVFKKVSETPEWKEFLTKQLR